MLQIEILALVTITKLNATRDMMVVTSPQIPGPFGPYASLFGSLLDHHPPKKKVLHESTWQISPILHLHLAPQKS